MKTLLFHNLKIGRNPKNALLEVDSKRDQLLFKSGLYLISAPNGYGKTSFLQTLGGLLLALEGEILFQQKQLIPELHALYFSEYLTVPKFIFPSEWIEFVSNKKFSYESLKSIIHDFAVENEMKTYLGMLSQGERRKMMWLGAHYSEKPLLLLDEPLDGLDFVGIQAARKLLKEWKEKEKIIFLVAHQPSEVLDLCNDIYVIQDKKISSLDLKEKTTACFRKKLFETYEKELNLRLMDF
ncbi:MAG: ATP-binding cassette domain-containing protein [Bdellovibrio sp.]|nr:ATP-binding cassette domain-containing protein [Bdellovibrio sp.]